MSKYGLLGKFTVLEGKQKQMVDILLEAADSLKDLEDCENYQISITGQEPNAVYVYEVWNNKQAHQDSLSLESTQTLIRQAKPIITGMERICTLNTLGGKGLTY